MSDLVVREYGSGDGPLIVLHGGPAAAGDVAPLARALGERWRVLEPFQRNSSDRLLTVATHVQDLDAVIQERCGGRQPAVIGHSWGAMLALAYAAAHPATPAALVLVGCGTFSARARKVFEARLDARLTAAQRMAIAGIDHTEPDPNRCLAAIGRILTAAYGYDVDDPSEAPTIDARAHQETWADMLRLQADGAYPAAFAAIDVPVLMLHGAADPHPGRLIYDDLRSFLPQLEYREIPECGHSPWMERRARQTFFDALKSWLQLQFQSV